MLRDMKRLLLAVFVACAAMGTTAATANSPEEMGMHEARSAARQAVAGIAYDLTGEVSVAHCHLRGVHAVCEAQVFGSFQTVRARVLETETATAVHVQVRALWVVPDRSKPDPG